MSYYSRWSAVIGTSIFQRFLKYNYSLGLSDLGLLNKSVSFNEEGFSCLLCGVGNEKTAKTFIEFVIERNSKARIYIIDLGLEQVTAVNKLVEHHFKAYDIFVKQMNALDLKSFLNKGSLHWIETDGFLEFFTHSQLKNLLTIWHFLLKRHGFITIREPAGNNLFESMIDEFRVVMGKWWLGVKIYIHTVTDLQKLFADVGFKYVMHPTAVPTFRRFTMIKKSVLNN